MLMEITADCRWLESKKVNVAILMWMILQNLSVNHQVRKGIIKVLVWKVTYDESCVGDFDTHKVAIQLREHQWSPGSISDAWGPMHGLGDHGWPWSCMVIVLNGVWKHIMSITGPVIIDVHGVIKLWLVSGNCGRMWRDGGEIRTQSS